MDMLFCFEKYISLEVIKCCERQTKFQKSKLRWMPMQSVSRSMYELLYMLSRGVCGQVL